MENKIKDLLEKHGIKSISEFEDFKKYFDINVMDEEGTPAIITEQKVVIIIDNEKYNETYLIDIFDEILSEKNLSAVEFVYVDEFDLKKMLLAPNIEITEKSKDDFEKTHLIPCVMTINPLVDEFNMFTEPLTPFNKEMLIQILERTKIIE